MAVTLTLGNRHIQVSGANLKTTRAIEKTCSYRVEGYYFSPAYRARRWDGKEHLFKHSDKLGYHAPSGMAQDIAELLREKGIDYDVKFTTKVKAKRRKLKWAGKPLRKYQKEAVRAILGKPIPGRGVVKMPVRSGKTLTMARVIWNFGLPTLFVVPSKSLLHQTAKALRKALPNTKVGLVGDGHYDPQFITVATIHTLSAMAPKRKKGERDRQEAHRDYKRLMNMFDLACFDECFVSGTMVGTRQIQDVQIGDLIPSFDGQKELSLKRVTHVFRKRPKALVKINFHNGKGIVCTPNHPFLTNRGWKVASDIDPFSDIVYHTICDENQLHELRRENRHFSLGLEQKGSLEKNGSSLLFNQMRPDVHRQSDCVKSPSEVSKNETGFFKSHEEKQPDEGPGCSRQGQYNSKSDRTHSGLDERRERASFASPTNPSGGHLGMEDRVFSANRQRSPKEEIGHCLQDRYCGTDIENRDRDRRTVPQVFEGETTGRKERKAFEEVGVDSIEILQPGSDGTFGGLCPDGHVYNLEVEENETYIANGFAVHNCHHIRGTGEWYQIFMEINARFKIGLSATVFFDNKKEQERGIIWLRAACGPIRIDIPAGRLIREGYLLPQHVKMYKCIHPVMKRDKKWSATLKKKCITENPHRNKLLAALVAEHAPMKTIVIAKEHAHIAALCEELDSLGIDHRTITGRDNQNKRDELIEGLVDGDYNVLVGNVVGEGIDIPAVECVVNAEGGKDEKTTWQRQRNLTVTEGQKEPPIMIDVYDKMSPYFEKHSKARLKVYKSESEFKVEMLDYGA